MPRTSWSGRERPGLPRVREGVPVLPEAPEPEQPGQVPALMAAALNASAEQAKVSRCGSAEVHELPKPTKKAAAKRQPAKEVTAKNLSGRRPRSA
ncbi:hypothetical protein [Streptomyces sp. NPDC048710]|uniref:hypothetical protein n=1 Tax=Streptomyces sp. NPDC048710 TaxID=3365586 RepID=UPI00371184C7